VTHEYPYVIRMRRLTACYNDSYIKENAKYRTHWNKAIAEFKISQIILCPSN
jgi:hypothetical protein